MSSRNVSLAIYSRFLSKEVKEANNDIGYGWTFMSFYLRVRVSGKEGLTVMRLMCLHLRFSQTECKQQIPKCKIPLFCCVSTYPKGCVLEYSLS